MLPILLSSVPSIADKHVRGDLSPSGNVMSSSLHRVCSLPDSRGKAGKFLDVSGSDPFSPKLVVHPLYFFFFFLRFFAVDHFSSLY